MRAVPGVFPEESFRITANPAAIRESAAGYLRFAGRAADALEAISTASADSWTGTEGDVYRARRMAYAPTMTQAQVAFRDMHRFLDKAADEIDAADQRMRALKERARVTWAQLEATRGEVAALTAGLGASTDDPWTRALALVPSHPLNVATMAMASVAQRWQGHLAEAAELTEQVRRSAAATATDIARIEAPPTAPPAPAGGPLTSSAGWSEDLLPRTAVERSHRSIEVTGTFGVVDGLLGMRTEIETLDDGRMVVRVLSHKGAGASVGLDKWLPSLDGSAGKQMSAHGGGGDWQVGIDAGLSAAGVYETGVVKIVSSESEAKQFGARAVLTGMLQTAAVDPSAWASMAGADGHRVSLSAEAGASASAGIGAETAGAEASAGVGGTWEQMNDGSSMFMLSGVAAANAAVTMGDRNKEKGVTGRGSITMRTSASGEASMALTTRVDKAGSNRSTEITRTTRLTPAQQRTLTAPAMAMIDKPVNAALDIGTLVDDLARADLDSPQVRSGEIVYQEKTYDVDDHQAGAELTFARFGPGGEIGWGGERLVEQNGVAR